MFARVCGFFLPMARRFPSRAFLHTPIAKVKVKQHKNDKILRNISNNYWMRFSMISSSNIQTEVNVIVRSKAEADDIERGQHNFDIVRKPIQ